MDPVLERGLTLFKLIVWTQATSSGSNIVMKFSE